jgi:hypothetical protein
VYPLSRRCADVCSYQPSLSGQPDHRHAADRRGPELFEGYACDYHEAALRSYSAIVPPMVGRYRPGQAYLAVQGRVFVVRYGYGEAANWQELENTTR